MQSNFIEMKEFEVSQNAGKIGPNKCGPKSVKSLDQKVSKPKTMGWVHFQGKISGIRWIWPPEIMK